MISRDDETGFNKSLLVESGVEFRSETRSHSCASGIHSRMAVECRCVDLCTENLQTGNREMASEGGHLRGAWCRFQPEMRRVWRRYRRTQRQFHQWQRMELQS